ncbi:MAG: sulfite exporter TauE/SafE family protein [Nanoarchaeota archaeon]
MELSLVLILLIVLSGFIKGFTGFGLSLILISVLFEIGFQSFEILPILVPLFVILDLILYYEHRNDVKLDFKENFSLHPTTLMTLFLGILFGTYLLTVIDGSYLKLIFGVLTLIMLFFLVMKVDMHQMIIPSERKNGFFGMLAGILTGLFTMNGALPSLYLIYHQYPKKKYMVSLVTFLILSDIILIAVYLFKDLFTISGFLISLQLFIMVLTGFLMGIFIRKYVSSKTFKSLVIAFLAINSIKIIFDFFFL